MHPSVCVTIALLVLAIAGSTAQGERAQPPERLTIGYENEGKIDASPPACLAYVKEITKWNEADMQRGAAEVCAARKKHVDAYDALQASYRDFIREVTKERRLDWSEAVATVPVMVKACMTHKFSITLPGHNIRLDIIPNEAAAACLALVSDLLRNETRQLAGK